MLLELAAMPVREFDIPVAGQHPALLALCQAFCLTLLSMILAARWAGALFMSPSTPSPFPEAVGLSFSPGDSEPGAW